MIFKRLTVAVLSALNIAIWQAPANAAGTIPGISMTQQLDQYAKPLSGGLLYLIQAGTTSTPQNCYQDTALTLPWPNPVTLDSAGRIPQLLCADGSIKIRLTDKAGVTQLVQDNILIIGASSGSGGGGTVDPTTVLSTGDMKITYGTGSLTGFVRANGRTIGSSTSGATERANADTQALFEYLWGTDSSLAVSGGRGASASADWAANKTIAVPDYRSRAIAGLDDMGNSAAGLLTSTNFGTDPTVLGAAGGSEKQTIAKANLPNTTFAFAGTGATITSTSNVNKIVALGGADPAFYPVSSAGGGNVYGMGSGVTAAAITSTASYTPAGTVSSGGSGTALPTVGPMKLTTIYLKL